MLLLGAAGMLGRDLVKNKPSHYDVTALAHADLDIRDTGELSRAIRAAAPSLVVNASGFTNVDAAEADPQTAFAVNATAVGELGRLCQEQSCAVMHYSTDYVFDGTKQGFYAEEDATGPLNVYGASKLEGEQKIRASGATHVIIRTQWLYGSGGSSFVSAVWDKALKRTPIRASNDQFGCCTYSVDLARLSWATAGSGLRGTFHIANRGRVSRFTLAKKVYDAFGLSELVAPCGTAEFPSPARRPANSPLHVGKIEQALGERVPEWTDALDRFLEAGSAGAGPLFT